MTVLCRMAPLGTLRRVSRGNTERNANLWTEKRPCAHVSETARWPLFRCDGIIAVGNAHKENVKLTFANGAKLADPDKLFNAGFTGSTWRAIDVFEGDKINAPALKKLIRAAVAFNQGKLKKKTPAGSRTKARSKKA